MEVVGKVYFPKMFVVIGGRAPVLEAKAPSVGVDENVDVPLLHDDFFPLHIAYILRVSKNGKYAQQHPEKRFLESH